MLGGRCKVLVKGHWRQAAANMAEPYRRAVRACDRQARPAPLGGGGSRSAEERRARRRGSRAHACNVDGVGGPARQGPRSGVPVRLRGWTVPREVGGRPRGRARGRRRTSPGRRRTCGSSRRRHGAMGGRWRLRRDGPGAVLEVGQAEVELADRRAARVDRREAADAEVLTARVDVIRWTRGGESGEALSPSASSS